MGSSPAEIHVSRLDVGVSMQPTCVGYNVFDKPCRGLFCRVFITVDLLLLESPIGKLLGMSPHRDFCGYVDQPEVS